MLALSVIGGPAVLDGLRRRYGTFPLRGH
jgi:hypothetical protein